MKQVLKICICFSLLFCLSLVVVLPAQAQSDPATAYGSTSFPTGVEKLLTKFFGLIEVGEHDLAFTELMKHSPIQDDTTTVRQLISNVEKSYALYGAMKGIEYLPAIAVTPSFIKVRALAKHERYPLRWQFTLYNSPAYGWIVTDIKLDDEAEYLFPMPGFER